MNLNPRSNLVCNITFKIILIANILGKALQEIGLIDFIRGVVACFGFRPSIIWSICLGFMSYGALWGPVGRGVIQKASKSHIQWALARKILGGNRLLMRGFDNSEC